MYLQILRQTPILFLILIFSIFGSGLSHGAVVVPQDIFPLDQYDQNVDTWIPASDPNYQKPLVEMAYQKERLKEFQRHYFSSSEEGLSPWSPTHVLRQLSSLNDLTDHPAKNIMKLYQDKNSNKIGYGVNFRPYDKTWIDNITTNMNIPQFKTPLHFSNHRRAIFVQNASARTLPTHEPLFYHLNLAGEGYPFDQLQISAIWAGTSAYIIGETQDKNWSFVLTPDFFGWVPSSTLAKASNTFIQQWERAAHHQLAAITQTETPIIDKQNQQQFNSYVGSVFPLISENGEKLQILFPAKDIKGFAHIRRAMLDKKQATAMPWTATPEHFAQLFKTLQNRPYGWGGLYFLNDCSAELKSLYTPFGFWLARHSSDQSKAGKMVDKSHVTPKERIEYLSQAGRPFITFVYNTRHVFVYLGNFKNSNSKDNHSIPMTYQNLWALKPLDASRRAIVGKALFLPLLETFPEDKTLNSHANHKDFQVIFLDEYPERDSK